MAGDPTEPNATLRLDAFLPYRLSIASNRVSDAVSTTYASLFGLRIPEWRLVAVLAEGDGLSQQALGRKTRMDKVTVSRAAIALAGRGLIVRESDASDKRAARLSLTPAGRDLYAQVSPKALAIEAELFGSFSAAELTAFRDMLDRIEVAATKLES